MPASIDTLARMLDAKRIKQGTVREIGAGRATVSTRRGSLRLSIPAGLSLQVGATVTFQNGAVIAVLSSRTAKVRRV